MGSAAKANAVDADPCFGPVAVKEAIARVRAQATVLLEPATRRVGVRLEEEPDGDPSGIGAFEPYRVLARLPAVYPERLGDRSFLETHHVRFPYVAGEMANGIATARMVVAMANSRTLGFFGAAGLSLPRIA